MTNNEKVFAEHPEWFALYGGKRDFKPGSSKIQLCYSNEGLFQETLRYVRALLDNYHFKCVSADAAGWLHCDLPMCKNAGARIRRIDTSGAS